MQHVLTGNGNVVQIRERNGGTFMRRLEFAQFKRDQLLLAVARDENRGDVVFEPVTDSREEAATGALRKAVQKTMGSGSRAKHALKLDHLVPFFGTCACSLLER